MQDIAWRCRRIASTVSILNDAVTAVPSPP
jgi:hypothetical protein